jgi:AraC-like DNA-binding protein
METAKRMRAPDRLDFLPDSLTILHTAVTGAILPAMLDLQLLREPVLRHAAGYRTATPIPNLSIVVSPRPTEPTVGLYQPMVCLVLQGAKEATIGGRTLRYDESCYFVTSLDLPASTRIIEASPERPYICLAYALDPEPLADVLTDAPPEAEPQAPAFAVSPVNDDLLDTWHRLLKLLDTPADIPVLAPLCEREILYRLLKGPQGAALRQIVHTGSHLHQIRRAIGWIKDHFHEPIRVDALADLAGMSPATFHRHFKAATAMSPLQYQKNLRLQEARRLIVTSHDAARTAFAVGYESPSQFSREYARLFGLPPARDAARMRGAEETAAMG